MTLLTESEAWREVAERIDLDAWGFFMVKNDLLRSRLISRKTCDAMDRRAEFWWTSGASPISTPKEDRVMLALFLELECLDEENNS